MVLLGQIQQISEFFNCHTVLVAAKDNEPDAFYEGDVAALQLNGEWMFDW